MRVPQFLREIENRNGTLVGISFRTESLTRTVTSRLDGESLEYKKFRPGQEPEEHYSRIKDFLCGRSVKEVLRGWSGGHLRVIVVCGPSEG